MSSYRFRRPPAALRKAHLDNLAVVPANLLPFKTQWQQIANRLPRGSALIILPAPTSPQRKTFETVVTKLQEQGKRVLTLNAERFIGVDRGRRRLFGQVKLNWQTKHKSYCRAAEQFTPPDHASRAKNHAAWSENGR
jgi:hypothetical protein